MLRKTALRILLLLPLFCGAQYVDLSGDLNNGFGLVENPGNQLNYRGADIDLEAGAVMWNYSAFLFYGRFDGGNYHNYGFGTDYYLAKGDWYDIAVGGGLSMILRKELVDVEPNQYHLFGFMGWMTRLSGVFWVYPKIGVSGRIGYQRRPDIDLHGIMEASIGIRVKLKEYKN